MKHIETQYLLSAARCCTSARPGTEVLIVENTKGLGTVLRAALRRCRVYTVEVATGYSQAEILASTAADRFALLVADVSPRRYAIDAIGRIRAAAPLLPMIAVARSEEAVARMRDAHPGIPTILRGDTRDGWSLFQAVRSFFGVVQ